MLSRDLRTAIQDQAQQALSDPETAAEYQGLELAFQRALAEARFADTGSERAAAMRRASSMCRPKS